MPRPTPFLKSQAWRTIRVLALRRDGYRCVKCKRDVSASGAARVDHIKPRKTHPHLALSLPNLRTLCTICDNQSHREKGGTDDSRSANAGKRQERIIISGARVDGTPLDPNHHWHKR